VTGVSEAGFGRALRAFRLTNPLQGPMPTALKLVPPNPWPGDATRGDAQCDPHDLCKGHGSCGGDHVCRVSGALPEGSGCGNGHEDRESERGGKR